jgi:hypothetical protein
VSALQLGRDTNLRRRFVPSIFESVREEILEHMSHLGRVPAHAGQGLGSDDGGDVGELFEFTVDSLQFLVRLPQIVFGAPWP